MTSQNTPLGRNPTQLSPVVVEELQRLEQFSHTVEHIKPIRSEEAARKYRTALVKMYPRLFKVMKTLNLAYEE